MLVFLNGKDLKRAYDRGVLPITPEELSEQDECALSTGAKIKRVNAIVDNYSAQVWTLMGFADHNWDLYRTVELLKE